MTNEPEEYALERSTVAAPALAASCDRPRYFNVPNVIRERSILGSICCELMQCKGEILRLFWPENDIHSVHRAPVNKWFQLLPYDLS